MKRAQKYLGFSDFWLMFIGIPLTMVTATLVIFGPEGILDWESKPLLAGALFTFGYWFAYRNFIIQYHKKFPENDFTLNRIWWVGSRMIIIYILVDLIIGYIVHQVFKDASLMHHKLGISKFIVPPLIIMLIFFIYEGIYYLNKTRIVEIEKNELEKITAEQRLDTLKNQVNPHFLFNSLNTLISIIPEDPETAILFVENLSNSYRNILEFRNEKLVPIWQELEALESYIYLLKTRFQGKIHIYNNVSDHVMDHFILPISLQILIENAVKHNITSSSKPLKIHLESNANEIVVKNNLQPKKQAYNSTKLGLANISSRYKLLAENEIRIEKTEHEFIVALPIIKKIET